MGSASPNPGRSVWPASTVQKTMFGGYAVKAEKLACSTSVTRILSVLGFKLWKVRRPTTDIRLKKYTFGPYRRAFADRSRIGNVSTAECCSRPMWQRSLPYRHRHNQEANEANDNEASTMSLISVVGARAMRMVPTLRKTASGGAFV